MEKEHLHLLIHEEIFQIKEKEEALADTEKSVEVENAQAEPVQLEQEPAGKHPEVKEREPAQAVSHETPDIPAIEPGKVEKLPFAVFHESTAPEELELIHKIIDACQLEADKHKIFGSGFDGSVQFDRALVFVSTAKAYYEPIPYKGSYFLCSQPATVLMRDQNQKLQLWEALQKFLGLKQPPA